MDDPSIDPDVHRQALDGLRRLNRISGVSRHMYGAIVKTCGDGPLRVLDIASGSADLPRDWIARRRRRRTPVPAPGSRHAGTNDSTWSIVTTDRSPFAVDQQRRHTEPFASHFDAVVVDVLSDTDDTLDAIVGRDGPFDVATCSLFLHHLQPGEIVKLLGRMSRWANAIVACDLLRSHLNYYAILVASRLVTRSDVVHCDALLSVKAAMTPTELNERFHNAGLTGHKVQTTFPCRMTATWTRR